MGICYFSSISSGLAVLPNDVMPEDWHHNDETFGLRTQPAWDLVYPEGLDQPGKLSPITVAILSTGTTEHVDLVGRVLPGYDFISNVASSNDGDARDSDASDVGFYREDDQCGPGVLQRGSRFWGTWYAGLVAANMNNQVGISGVAPNAYILPLRIYGACGYKTLDTADAIRWAVGLPIAGLPDNNYPAKIIFFPEFNYQAGCAGYMQAAFNDAREKGAVIFVESGRSLNNARSEDISPGNCTGVVSVAPIGKDGLLSARVATGNNLDILAPGGDRDDNDFLRTLSNTGLTVPEESGYIRASGHGVATAFAVGVAAMVLGANPDLTPDQVEAILKETARPLLLPCQGCGAGVVDAHSSLQRALNSRLAASVGGPVAGEGGLDDSSLLPSQPTAADGEANRPTITLSLGDSLAASFSLGQLWLLFWFVSLRVVFMASRSKFRSSKSALKL